jgi:hypothetical protein
MLTKPINFLIIAILSLGLLTTDTAVTAQEKSEAASLKNTPCGSNSFDACADIGNTSDEAFHSLSGWGSNEVGGPILPPSSDPSKRYQKLRGDSSVVLQIPQSNIAYTLYTEVEDGGCDDSWSIYVNGQGPVYTYIAQPGINTGLSHQVSIPANYFSDINTTITFHNIASDNCGLAAVFFVKLERTSSATCQLAGVPVFYQGWPSTPNSLPNKPKWYDNTYGNYPQGDSYHTIGLLGCNTTSNAMIVNYFAQLSGSSLQTDPGSLNDWLRTHEGYNDTSGVKYGKVSEYAWKKGKIKLTLTGIGSPDNNYLDQQLCSGNPAMLKVTTSYGSHFVVAVGKTVVNGKDTYLINDPIWGMTTLQEHYDGVYQAAYYYHGGNSTINRSMLAVSAHSPVHILITDPFGRKTGYDPRTGEVWKEIPGGNYLTESLNGPDGSQIADGKLILLPQPIGGDYLFQVIGYASGSYIINVSQTNVFGDSETKIFTGDAQYGSVDDQSIIFNPGTLLYLPIILSSR